LKGKWLSNELPATLSFQDMKFIKLHDSHFHLIYTSVQGKIVLIGEKFTVAGDELSVFVLVFQSPSIQLQSQALKDITEVIIQLGQKVTAVTIIRSNTVQISASLLGNKQIISTLIESVKPMHFLCEYKDKGDKIELCFQYKQVREEKYPDEVYKQYLK
jgi:hypothetical protein